MDPNACLIRLLRALADRDFDEAEDALDDYRSWIRKGGFPAPILHDVRRLVENG